MINIKRSRLYALGAINFMMFALICLIAQGETDPKKYLLSILPGYAMIQILLVTGWNESCELKKKKSKEKK